MMSWTLWATNPRRLSQDRQFHCDEVSEEGTPFLHQQSSIQQLNIVDISWIMKTFNLVLTLFSLVVRLGLLSRCDAFTSSFSPVRPTVRPTSFRTVPIYIFGRNKEGDESSNSESTEPRKRSVPFFGRLGKQKQDSVAETSTPVIEKPVVTTVGTLTVPSKEPLDPIEQAKLLRAQAERTRLEAERMDVSLTLSKIDRLERQLKDARKKGEAIDELQRQLDNLQAKLRGEAPKPAVALPLKSQVKEKESIKVAEVVEVEKSTKKDRDSSKPLNLPRVLGNHDFEEMKWLVQNSPGFVQKLIAGVVEVDYESGGDVNLTEVVTRLTMAENGDFSYSRLSKPTFTEDEIQSALKQVENSEIAVPTSLMASFGDDRRKLAMYVLESKYYLYDQSNLSFENEISNIFNNAENEEAFKDLVALLNATTVDRLISNNYPRCMRKEGSQEPTLAQVQLLAGTVLPRTKFSASSKPEKVSGGYIIQGTHTYKDGNLLIEAIDKELAKASLSDKMTVFLTDDFVAVSEIMETDQEMILDMGQTENPMLYITGPDIVRDPKPVALSLVSGLGLATSWYFSIYPFLLNPNLAKRVEEQLSVADAGMNYDLQWLTDLSVPLFVAFLGLQVLHEAGHRIAGGVNDVSPNENVQHSRHLFLTLVSSFPSG